ncbi:MULTISPECIES: fimbrial protein [unclassified Serratia (in: enterobacteria)]|uniref:fimbrial protein n=1 Tax=unclassified Serratia (in: enterobacteria) TaxID=2647522 RepID=UPI00046A4E45|nr:MULTISPECIES: fimbrial protein [unclassified Serratia (in: enterobacteria)]
MKKTLMTLALVASGFVASSVYAADGTINFTGEITDQACTVDSTSQNLQVPLGKIAASSFNGQGSYSAATNFTLKLKDCPLANTATVKFDGTSVDGDNSVLALASGAGVAGGVGIELSDATQTVVNLFANSASYNLTAGVGSETDLNFTARYKALSTVVTPGVANASVQFSIIYN